MWTYGLTFIILGAIGTPLSLFGVGNSSSSKKKGGLPKIIYEERELEDGTTVKKRVPQVQSAALFFAALLVGVYLHFVAMI